MFRHIKLPSSGGSLSRYHSALEMARYLKSDKTTTLHLQRYACDFTHLLSIGGLPEDDSLVCRNML